MFINGGSPYSPYPYSSPLYKLEIKVIKTRAVCESGHLGLTVKDKTHQVSFFTLVRFHRLKTRKQKYVLLHGFQRLTHHKTTQNLS